MSYSTNIFYDAAENRNFRTVTYTGEKSQLVLMSIPPGGDIGTETHKHVEQSIFVLRGKASATLDGRITPLKEGDVLIVSPGVEHNIENIGPSELKLFTVYAPPNHLEGRVHATKADAERDREDEKFGEGANLLRSLVAVEPSLQDDISLYAPVPGVFPAPEPHIQPGNPLVNPIESPVQIIDLPLKGAD